MMQLRLIHFKQHILNLMFIGPYIIAIVDE